MRDFFPADAAGRVPFPLLALVVVVAAAVYLPSLRNGFAYDDVQIVQNHEELHDLGNLPERLVSPYWSSSFGRVLGLWRPVTTAALALQWSAWDGRPAGFHAVNLALHAGATLLVTLLLGFLLPVGGAVAGGLVFALHPLHVEAVANVVGLAELLSTTFFLAACVLHLHSREREGGRGRQGPGAVAGVSILYLLAFLSKEGAIVLPGVLFVLDAYLDRLRARELGAYLGRRIPLYLSLAAVAALVFLGRWLVLGSVARPEPPLGAGALADLPRHWTALGIWPEYFRLLLFPADLSADYSPRVIPVLLGWTAESVAGLVLGLGLLGGALLLWRRAGPADAGPLVLGLLWFVVTVLPVSNVFFLSGVLLAERTLYLPSVAVALATGWLAAQLTPLRLLGRGADGFAGTVLALGLAGWTVWLGVRTVERIPVWESTGTVFVSLLREHPESGRARWFRGDMLAMAGREEEAIEELRLAFRIIGPRDYIFLVALGQRLTEMERPRMAELYLRYAVNDAPQNPQAHMRLAELYRNTGRWREAERAARNALETGAPSAPMRRLLATALEEQGRWREAVPHRRDAAEAAPDDWRYWAWLARAEREAGMLGEACRSYAEVLLRTEDPGVARAVDSLRTAVGRELSGSGCPPAGP